MNGTLPYVFFFSYSRADSEYDVYFAKFFEDLERKGAIVTGSGTRKVGFRDEEGVKTGRRLDPQDRRIDGDHGGRDAGDRL